MDIRLRIRVQKVKTSISKAIGKIFKAPFGKLNEMAQNNEHQKQDRRITYNMQMSDEELVKRLLKGILKDAIKWQENTIEFDWCESELRPDIRECGRFIVDNLSRFNKDKQLNHWLRDNNIREDDHSLILSIEHRLHLELVRQLETMGIKTYYIVDNESTTPTWRAICSYVRTLVIELPA